MVDLELQDVLDVRDLLFLRQTKTGNGNRVGNGDFTTSVRIDHVCAHAPARLTTGRRLTYLRPAKEAVLAELLPVRPFPVLLRREAVESPKPLAVLLVDRDEHHTLLHSEHEVGQPLAEPVASPRRRHEGVAVGVREGIERPLCYEG